MGINSARILKSLGRGVLAQGWKFIALSAFCFVYGIVALDLSVSSIIAISTVKAFLGYSGAAFQAIGALIMAFGIKSQYDAWNPKGMMKPVAHIETTSASS